MALGTATIQMQCPEQHRERLHDLVKATRAVLVLSCSSGERVVGQPMLLLRTADDTTLYVATALDADELVTLASDPRVTVVVGAGAALFDAEAVVLRERELLDGLPREAWKLWGRKKSDPSIKVLEIRPIEGAYWAGSCRHSYQYRSAPRRVAALCDAAPMAMEG